MKRGQLQRKTPLKAKTTLTSTKRLETRKRQLKKSERTRKTGKKSMAKLKKELDRLFSRYIRLTNADNAGNVTCYTCRKVKHWKQMQCGHFVPRQYLATRWSEANCRPQCAGCNLFGDGMTLDFEERLKAELGDDIVEDLKRSRHQTVVLSTEWYERQIARYSILVSRL